MIVVEAAGDLHEISKKYKAESRTNVFVFL